MFWRIKFLRHKITHKKAVNDAIKKIAKYFEKKAAVRKSKELKRYAKNILPDYKE